MNESHYPPSEMGAPPDSEYDPRDEQEYLEQKFIVTISAAIQDPEDHYIWDSAEIATDLTQDEDGLSDIEIKVEEVPA